MKLLTMMCYSPSVLLCSCTICQWSACVGKVSWMQSLSLGQREFEE